MDPSLDWGSCASAIPRILMIRDDVPKPGVEPRLQARSPVSGQALPRPLLPDVALPVFPPIVVMGSTADLWTQKIDPLTILAMECFPQFTIAVEEPWAGSQKRLAL